MHVRWQAVLDLAGDQYGLVTRDQIRGCGVTDRMIAAFRQGGAVAVCMITGGAAAGGAALALRNAHHPVAVSGASRLGA